MICHSRFSPVGNSSACARTQHVGLPAPRQCAGVGARQLIPHATSTNAAKDVTGLSSLRFSKPEGSEMASLMSEWSR